MRHRLCLHLLGNPNVSKCPQKKRVPFSPLPRSRWTWTTEAPCNCNDKCQTNGTRPWAIQEVSGNYPPEKRENTHPHTPKPPEWDDGKIFSDRNSITVFLLSSYAEDSGYPTNNSHNAVEGISEPLDGHTCTHTFLRDTCKILQ